MMQFSDIHTHILYGVDDGAGSYEEMITMVDAAYKNGTRYICSTPHFCPGEFGDNSSAAEKAFEELKVYCRDKYHDLKLILGNELFYMEESLSWLKRGLCKTMGNSRYVLVEFNVTESEWNICDGVYNLVQAGYVPIIAHAERYEKLPLKTLKGFRDDGALIQVNAQSFTEGFAFFRKKRLKALLADDKVDFVSTDSHSMTFRPPVMTECYNYISAKYGKEYADKLCFKNAFELFFENNAGEE